MSQRHAFVTGANGFLGTNLVHALCEQGWQVTALKRPGAPDRGLAGLDVRIVEADVNDIVGLRRVFPEGVDAVFHAAGNTSLWPRHYPEQTRVNVKGTRNVVRLVRERGAGRLVHVSALAAWGLFNGTVTERTPSRGLGSALNYARSKALAEREVHKGLRRGVDAVIICPAHAIGAHDRRNWSRLFRLVRQRRVLGMPPGGSSFCHARAVARAMIAAVDRGERGASYLLGGADASYVRLLNEIAALLGRRTRFRPLPVRLLQGYAMIEEMVAPLFGREPDITVDAVRLLSCSQYCSSERAIRELGYEPLPLEQMLADCHRWMADNGLL